MSQVRPTNLADILLAVQDRLMAVLGWPEERVFLDADSEGQDAGQEASTQAEQYVRVRWADSDIDQGSFVGAGRYGTQERVTLDVELWTRLNLDSAGAGAESFLTHATLGHAKARHSVWNALAGFQPSDSQGNWLVVQPMTPRRGRRPRRKKNGDGWGSSVLTLDVLYLLNLDVTTDSTYI